MALSYRQFLRETRKVSMTSYEKGQSTNLTHVPIDFEYYDDEELMIFHTTLNSFEGRGAQYDLIVAFEGVEPNQFDMKNIDFNRNIHNGLVYPTPVLVKNPLRVRCDCESFRFTGSEAAVLNTSFIGPSYRPWRPNRSGRAPRNPRNRPMLCKHLISFIDYLVREGYVQEYRVAFYQRGEVPPYSYFNQDQPGEI